MSGFRKPTIEWQVCGVCNYDCSYCIQSKVYRTGHPSTEDIEGFLGFFERTLQGVWEIKMTGGEPFAFKGFMERIIPGLIGRTPHRVSVLTNLSAPLGLLERFAEYTMGRLDVVSASIHLEHVDAQAFATKAAAFAKMLDPRARLVINGVLVPGKLDQVKRAKEALAERGLAFFPQLLKAAGGVHDYSGEDVPLVQDLVGISPNPRQANLAPSYLGRRCYAGLDYFVLLQNGDAWSCRTAKRHKEGYLGNVLQGSLVFFQEATPCPYKICPCTVPANRGMIEGVGP